LSLAGWTVVRVWEHEGAQTAVDRILSALSKTGDQTVSSR
jgi:hypothetical protein